MTRLTFCFGLLSTLILFGCSDDVGKVSLGLFTTKDVVITAKQDPILSGVTCHISHVYPLPIKMHVSVEDKNDLGKALIEENGCSLVNINNAA